MKSQIWIFICLIIGTMLFIQCQKTDGQRKIRLSDQPMNSGSDAQLSTTIYLEEQQRRSMAVWFFQNETGDENLEWLQKGLTEMFIRALSQSSSLSVMGTDRLYEIIERLGEDVSSTQMDMDMAAIFAQEANVEALLTGNISKHGDSLQINISLHEPDGIVLSKESIEGPGLENLFAMVDQLTQKLKQDMRLSSEKQPERSLTELSTNSLEAWQHYTAGMDFENQMLISEAMKEFQKAIQADSNFVSAHYKLAMAYFGYGDAEKGIRSYQKAQSLKDKATFQERMQIDLFEAMLKNDDEALFAIHEQMMTADPNNIEASYTLANYYFGNQEYDNAAKYYQKILEIDPKHKMSYNQMGYSSAFHGDFEGAKKAFRKYIDFAPDEPNPYDSLGEINWIQGNYKEAEKCFKIALEKNQAFTAGWSHLGQIYLEQGKYKKALKVYETLRDMETERAPKSAAHYSLGVTAMRMNQDDKAIAHFSEAIELMESSNGSIDRLMEIYNRRDDEQTAEQFLIDLYKRLLKNLESGDQSIDQIGTLAKLSLDYNIHPEKTLKITQHVAETMEIFNVRLFAGLIETLLKFQLQQPAPVESLASGIDHQELPGAMRGLRNFGWAGFWQYFDRINTYYYSHPRGEHLYKNLIELCTDESTRSIRITFQMLLSDLYLNTGRIDEAEALWQMTGIPDESFWRVIGPFENRNGFGKKFPPEKKIDFTKIYKSNGQKTGWQLHSDSFYDGFINLKKDFAEPNWAVAYGVLDIKSEFAQQVWIRLGTTDGIKVWVNEEEVWRFNRIRPARLDEDKFPIQLKAGTNRILVKVCNYDGQWGFYFRISDEAGNSVPYLQFISPDS
ncbi:tetratricopeptide repeat protein [candidate division KSB1 bacterium]|nr:tetratricopeptide repeat protein [candidate division KSB1 bacterium]